MHFYQVSGFWKGLSVPLASQVALNAIIFGVEGCARKLLPESKSNFDKVIHPMISGATAGLAQSFVCSPMELIKLRMQMQDIGTKRSQNFAGVLEQTRRIWSQGGIRGINKGLGVVMLRDSVGFAAYIAAYDVLQQRMADHFDTCVDKLSFLHLSIAGGSAGCISWAVNYPVERVRVQIQDDVDGRYRGIIDCTRKIIAEERLYGLFKGFVPCMARAFLCSCTLLPAMTYTKRHWLWTVD